jgi:hypothetical protein
MPAPNEAAFWLMTLPLSKDAEHCQVVKLADPPEATADGGPPKSALAVEVWRWHTVDRPDGGAADSPSHDDSHWAVLIATADDLRAPTRLTCVFGVTNDPEWCDIATSKGLPVIEGAFEDDHGYLVVHPAVYPIRDHGQPSSPKHAALVRIGGLFEDAARGKKAERNPIYDQLQTTPDAGEPNSVLLGSRITCDPYRTQVTPIDSAGLRVRFERVLYPDLDRLTTESQPTLAWYGTIGNPQLLPLEKHSPGRPVQQPAGRPPRAVRRFKRESVFGAPAFEFEDIEIIGFRINVDGDGKSGGRVLLAKLIDDLNFHRAAGADGVPPVEDFRYEPATSTVVIELIRYGKMKSRAPLKPLEPDDFMSQHELLVRVLVGRVDDDTAQARDPAVFVPAIVVDNPWSKAVGRHLQGFPKMLAAFCVDGRPLAMDGRDAEGNVVSLTRVSQIHLVERIDGAAPTNTPLLTVHCPDDATDADRFEPIDVKTLFGDQLFSGVPWRQGDFMDRLEFRRSFARSVIANRFNTFRNVQVSPVGDIGLPKTWLAGRFSLDHVAVAFPSGVATLRFGAPLGLPPAWQTLCGSLRAQYGDTIGLPTGSWYRLRCSMNLDVEDALSW